MEITNDSDQDTKYRVTNSGGGSGMDPKGKHFKAEEALSWPLLRAGETVDHTPVPPGPWTVYFVIDGKRVDVTAKSVRDRIRLTATGNTFKADAVYTSS